MRIAYLCMDRGVPVFGWTGSSIHVQEVVRGFLAQGARVELQHDPFFRRRIASSSREGPS